MTAIAFSAIHQPAPLAPLPQVTPEHAVLSRVLGLGRVADLPGCGAGATLTLGRPGAASPVADDVLLLAGDFGALRLHQGARLLHAITGIDLDGAGGPQDSRWTWLEAAVLGRLDGTPFSGARQIAPAGAPDRDQHGPISLPLILRGGGHCIATTATADATCWTALLRTGHWRHVAAVQGTWESLAPAWPLRLGRHRLTLAQLRTCRPGDILLPDAALFDCDGSGAAMLGPYRLRLRFDTSTSLTILALEQIMTTPTEHADASDLGDTDADTGAGAPAPTAPDTLDQLPLSIDFELGSLRLTLAELRRLGKGSVVELADASTAAVAIVCAGRRLGRGEAVDVGGRLGIRITDWNVA